MSGRFNLSAARLELLQTMLRAEGIDRAPARSIPLRPDRAAPAPLTFSQHRLWFLEHFAEQHSAYVISAALRVRGPLRFDVFAEACAEVTRRHEVLRTVFVEIDGRPCQMVRDELPPEVRVSDLGAAAGDVTAEVQRREEALIARPFDLAAGPLMRVELLRLGPDDAVVLLNLHHIVSDRWSMAVLMRELTQVYAARLAGADAGLPELPVQYPDFAVWQQGASFEATWEAELAYWLGQLRGSRADTGLPSDRPRPKEKTYRGSSVPVQLPPDLVAAVRELARAERATPFMVLVAAFAALLSRLGDSDDIVIGTPVANRTLVELEPLIGLFVNTLALRVDAGGNPSLRELVRRVGKVCLDAYAHQHVPFERLVERLQPERSLAVTPVFQVLLSYQNVPFPAWQQGPVRIEPIALPARKAEFDLLLDLFEDGDTVWGRLEYSTDLFTDATAGHLAGALVRLLSAAAADPDRPLAGIALDPPPAPPPAALGGDDATGWVHQRVEEHARRTPEATAVRVAGRDIGYGELNRRANQLAGRLRRAGAGAETVVAIAMPSSLELAVSLLAVAKAGAASLRLDPDTEPDRVAALLGGSRMLLTLRPVAAGLPVLGVPVLCVDELEHLLAAGPGEDLGVAVDGAQAARLVHTLTPDDRVVLAVDTFAGLRGTALPELLAPPAAGAPGRPSGGRRAYVLDRFGQPLPPGLAGELCLAGPGLPRGYAGEPGLTAQRLVPDPFVPGERMLRTGEMVRRRDDGTIEALGRLDRRVTVRGFRADLAELEAALAALAGVERAAVLAPDDGAGGRLVAYAETGADLSGERLLDELRQRLPEYLVPAAVLTRPQLPSLPSGAVDRSALPRFEAAPAAGGGAAPRSDLERLIAEVWRAVLDVPAVGIHDSFFNLGGHSLLATKVVAQLRTGHGLPVPLRALFDNPTVAALAAWIAEQAPAGTEEPIPVADRAAGVPLGFAQQVLCEHHPLGPEHPQHNVVTSLLLRGPLDEPALRRSLDAMVARHEPLRTRFVHRPDGWVQLIDPAGTWPLSALDLRGTESGEPGRRLREVVEAERRRPFALDREPPMRAALVRIGTDDYAVVLVLHHLVTDNWSYAVLVRDLCELYRAHVEGGPPRLPALERDYADVVAWQQARLADGSLRDRIAYWQSQLRGLPPAPVLAADGPEAATGYSTTFTVDAGRAAALRALARGHDASLFMVLMAAFGVLLSAQSGRDDVPVAFPEAGRDRPETEHLLGYFVNYLLVRADLSADPTFSELLGQVRAKTLDGYGNRGVPLWRLDGVAGPGDAPFRIVFNLLNAPIPDVRLHGLRAVPLDLGGDHVFREVSADLAPSDVDLALILREDGDVVRGTWLYALDRVEPRAVAALVRRWPRLLELVSDEPGRRVGGLRRAVREA
ncbi:condensation domain-containing protein [Dactylosporangium sp. CA-233914]|uniref:condensation domain-containing protein n=1 Tax=Dactylosporangium sp. CA-233914 TaxID=3239934 RepID=UPI003D8DFFDB